MQAAKAAGAFDHHPVTFVNAKGERVEIKAERDPLAPEPGDSELVKDLKARAAQHRRRVELDGQRLDRLVNRAPGLRAAHRAGIEAPVTGVKEHGLVARRAGRCAVSAPRGDAGS